jgi:hypothetical protein
MTQPEEMFLLPQRSDDATTVVRVLSDPAIANGLAERFGVEQVVETVDAARGTLVWAIDGSWPGLVGSTEATQVARNQELGQADALLEDATLPGAVADVVAEPPLFPLEGEPGLRGRQAEIALDALHIAAKRPGALRVQDTLSRVAPSRVERIVRMGVVRTAMWLNTLSR